MGPPGPKGDDGDPGAEGPPGVAGPQGPAGSGALNFDDSTGAKIATFAGLVPGSYGGAPAFGLVFSGHDVPIIYAATDPTVSATLIPRIPSQLFFTSTNCTGTPRVNTSDFAGLGLGAYNLAVSQGGVLNVFGFTGLRQNIQMGSMLQSGSCSTNTSTYNFYTTQEVTGLSTPPASIPGGYRISVS